MCSQSSDGDSFQGPYEGRGTPPAHRAGRSRDEMIRRAYAVGPTTACLIERLWDQAALQARWDSLEVLQFARWYSCQRVERAAIRLLNRGAGGRLDVLRLVLEEELDLLTERRDADLAGQLVFPFGSTEVAEAPPGQQSGNWDMIAGFAITGSRESW